MLRDVTAALRRPGDKAASPEACAMLREALDGLDDALENHELAHTVGPLLDEAKATLASDDIPEEESQEWAERLASYEVSDLVGWSFDGIDDWSTLGDRVRDFAPTIEAAIVYLAPHFIPQIQLRERRVQGVDRVEIVWPGESHELVIALHANREHDSWRLETSWRLKTSPPQTIVESGPLDTLNLPLALLATIDVPPLRWSPFALQVTPAWVPPDGCKVTSRLGDIVGCTLTPAALAACEADPAVLIAEESTGKCHNGTEGG